jgi:hypothetical protein
MKACGCLVYVKNHEFDFSVHWAERVKAKRLVTIEIKFQTRDYRTNPSGTFTPT